MPDLKAKLLIYTVIIFTCGMIVGSILSASYAANLIVGGN